jgi:hypothetical protein
MFSTGAIRNLPSLPWIVVLEGRVVMRIVTMREKILSLSHIGSQLPSADRLALLQVADFAGTPRLATWTLDSVRPALQCETTRPAAPTVSCSLLAAMLIISTNQIQPGPPMRNNWKLHHMAQAWPICMHAAFTAARPERARYWLVADCRTALSDVALLSGDSIAS